MTVGKTRVHQFLFKRQENGTYEQFAVGEILKCEMRNAPALLLSNGLLAVARSNKKLQLLNTNQIRLEREFPQEEEYATIDLAGTIIAPTQQT